MVVPPTSVLLVKQFPRTDNRLRHLLLRMFFSTRVL
jgi:hypothetical protein